MTVLPPDPYKILGVLKDAQITDIRSAYRKLVLKCHPDKIQDPALKEAKQIEFQQVQQAYELLSNEFERERYDQKAEIYEATRARNAAAKAAAASAPKQQDPGYYNVKDASPRATTFAKSSPYGRTPPRSWEDTTAGARLYEEPSRSARKTASYEKEKPSKRDEDRRRRKEDEERDKAREREREREREQRERESAARKSKERKEEKDRIAREREDRDKEKRKEEKKKTQSEKERGKERKTATTEKHRSRPLVVDDTSDSSDSSDENSDVDFEETPPPRTDRKKSGSGHKPEDIDPPSTERTRKYSGNMETAIRYLTRSGTKAGPHGFVRSQTYTEGSSRLYSTPLIPVVPTPPPAASAPFQPPPPPPVQVNEPEELSDDADVARRSSARPPRRMSSHETPRSSREHAHKKGSSSRDHPVIIDAGSPPGRTAPSMPRAATENYARPIPINQPPKLTRAETFHPPSERERERHERSRSRPTPPMFTDEELSEDNREHRRRRSRRTHSPEAMPQTRYTVSDSKAVPIRQKSYYDQQPPRNSYKAKGGAAYVTPNSSARVQRGHPTYARDYYEGERVQHYPNIKYSPQYDEQDIQYSHHPGVYAS